MKLTKISGLTSYFVTTVIEIKIVEISGKTSPPIYLSNIEYYTGKNRKNIYLGTQIAAMG